MAFHLGPVITNKVEAGVGRCMKWKGRISSKQGWDSLLEKVFFGGGFVAEGVVFLAQGHCTLDFLCWSRPGMVSSTVPGTEQK